MDESAHNIIQALEAALFIYGELIPRKKLVELLKIEPSQLDEALRAYKSELAAENRGLMLLVSEDAVQLTTKPELAPFLEGLAKEEFNEELTKAALETLAIVAYLGPISRPEIDYIRGVNSSFILRSLLLRKLVDRNPDPNRLSGIQYAVSFDALRHLGLSKNEELPDFAKYRELLKLLRKAPSFPAAAGSKGTQEEGAEPIQQNAG